MVRKENLERNAKHRDLGKYLDSKSANSIDPCAELCPRRLAQKRQVSVIRSPSPRIPPEMPASFVRGG